MQRFLAPIAQRVGTRRRPAVAREKPVTADAAPGEPDPSIPLGEPVTGEPVTGEAATGETASGQAAPLEAAPKEPDAEVTAAEEPAEEEPAGGAVTAEGAPAAPPQGIAHRRLLGQVRWEALGVFVFSSILAVALYKHAWHFLASVHVGGAGDADEYTWFLSWMPYALGHGINPLLSTYVNHAGSPNGINLMWNTSVILPSFLLSPLTVLAGPVAAYNVLITAAPVLSTTFAYVAFRRWSSVLPALTGALVFGFSPAVASQSVGHLAQVLLVSAPLMLILLDRLLVVQTSRAWLDGVLLGLLAWAQLLTGEEVLAIEVLAAAIGVLALCLINDRAVIPHVRHAVNGLAVAVGTFAVLAAPFLAEQYLGPDRVQDVHPPNVYVNDLLNFFVPTNVTQLAPRAALNLSAHFTGNGSEQGAYIGIPLLLLLGLSCWLARRRRVTWVALCVAAAAAILSMGPTVHVAGHVSPFPLPDRYLQRLPFFHNLLPDRFAVLMFLGAGLVLALGLHELAQAKVPLRVAGWSLAVLGLAAICPVVNYPIASSPPLAAFYTGWVCPPGASSHPGNVLVIPATDEMALRWQDEAGFCFTMPSATGMTGTNSSFQASQDLLLTVGTPPLALPALTPPVRAEAAGDIVTLGVSEIIVAPWQPALPTMSETGQHQLVAWVTELLGEQPQQNGDTYRWAHLPSVDSIADGG